MPKIALVAGGELTKIPTGFDQYVGVDRGSLAILQQGLELTLAVGDFDSVTSVEKDLISQQAKEAFTAPSHKNDTDTELALKTIFKRYPTAKVSVFGAFGGRLDHLFANVFLPSDKDLAPFMEQIQLLDGCNHVSFLPAGHHSVSPVSGMTYVAFMTSETTQLTITGAKYELTEANFFSKRVYSSNEFADKPIDVSFSKGYLIVIQSKDR